MHRFLFLAWALLTACNPTDGEAGVATLQIQNESDRALTYTFKKGTRGDPAVVATTVAPRATTAILKTGGCFGCADPPAQMVAQFSLQTADTKATVLTLDPVKNDDWKTVRAGAGEYDATHTLVVTQPQVDAAKLGLAQGAGGVGGAGTKISQTIVLHTIKMIPRRGFEARRRGRHGTEGDTMETLYTAEATATGGRDGRVVSSDGVIDMAVVMPKSLGGPGVGGTNPEQLFAAGYAACFGSALGLVARMQKVQLGAVKITAKVSIGKADGGFGLAVELHGHLPELPREQAEALMQAAHGVCPYSKATRNNIEVKLVVD